MSETGGAPQRGERLLTLMRHGEAAAPLAGHDGLLDDHARPLVERGRRDVLAVAARTALRGDRPDLLLCSDARRTVETAELVRESFGLDAASLASDARLYLASPETLLAVIAEHDARGVAHLMIVGHNPGLEELAARLDPRTGAYGMSTATLRRYARPDSLPSAADPPSGAGTRLLLEERP